MNCRGLTSAEADAHLLDIVRRVELYGLRLQPAVDPAKTKISLAVSFAGVVVLQVILKFCALVKQLNYFFECKIEVTLITVFLFCNVDFEILWSWSTLIAQRWRFSLANEEREFDARYSRLDDSCCGIKKKLLRRFPRNVVALFIIYLVNNRSSRWRCLVFELRQV